MSLQRPITDSITARARSLVPLSHLADRERLELLAASTLIDYEEGDTVSSPAGGERMNAYLLDGVLGEAGEIGTRPSSLRSENRDPTLPLDLDAQGASARRALCPALVLWVPCRILERLLTARFPDSQREATGNAAGSASPWVGKLLGAAPFNRLSPAVVQEIFARLEDCPSAPGEFLVREGEPGGHYYLIAEGRCVVTREPAPGAPRQPLAVLGPGEAFGEEALLSGSPRNASVAMLGPGRVMRLPKADFLALLKDSLLAEIDWEGAQTRVANGLACFVDVRAEREARARPFPQARPMPLRSLRAQALKLDRRFECIVVCENGSSAAAGAFILASLGFTAFVLAGGLQPIDAAHLASTTRGSPRAPTQSASGSHAVVFSEGVDGAEIARLRARIRELEAENARLRATSHGEPVRETDPQSSTDTRLGIAASRTIVQSSVSVPPPVEPARNRGG